MMSFDLQSADIKTPKFSLKGIECEAKCVKVYDGDTAQFVFRPFSGYSHYRFSCRMTGYNSAEIKGGTAEEKSRAIAARDALKGLILDKIVTLQIGDFDKYGRPLVNVKVDDIDVNMWMLANNYGKPYNGNGEKKW